MSIAVHDPTARDTSQKTSLFSLLSNHLVLQHTAPNLSARDRLALGATNRDFRHLVNDSPGVFRYLDLSAVKTAQFDLAPIDVGGEVWRNVQVDENVTEDDFYSGPLRGIFATLQRRHLLSNVQTLVLDGLSVTADLCNEIITDPSYNVRILSVRGVKNLNEGRLRGALKYACRPSRPAGTPKLKGLYIFTDPARDEEGNDPWYDVKGRTMRRDISLEWADTMIDCQGIIAFDAVLCKGPRHLNSPAAGTLPDPSITGRPFPQFAVATDSLRGCEGCGAAPEGTTTFDPSADRTQLPLLPAAPHLSSSIKAATYPASASASFIARCGACLEDRHCVECNKWWCETCYAPPHPSEHEHGYGTRKVHRSCVGCGSNCTDCINQTQKHCTGCGGGYCIIHNEGSSATMCDWCESRRRRAAPRAAAVPAIRRPQPQPTLTPKSKQAWANWMRSQNSIGELRARERTFPREGLRCLAARS